MFLTRKNDPLFIVFTKTIGFLFFLLLAGLFIDSKFVTPHFSKNQIIANLVIVVLFFILYKNGTIKIRSFLKYAVLIAIAGECFFSLYLEMYTYRLGNVPLYVFPGHAIVFASVLYFCKAKKVKENKQLLEKIFSAFIILYASCFLIFANDRWGFILTCLTLFILAFKPRERLFYLTMYLCVAYLEIVGTWYKCWFWPPFAVNIEHPWLASYNPPSGISFFYFGLDLGSLFIYKMRNRLAWKRMKNIRKIKLSLS